MSSSDFVKGACKQCGGHLEYPKEAIGQTVPCPHCGKSTELAPGGSGGNSGLSKGAKLGIAVALCVCAVVPAAILVMQKTRQTGVSTAGSPLVAPTNTPAAQSTATPPEPQPEAETNDFAILPYQLEKVPGSSLVYVTGTVRNLSSQQRFGVKLAFSLYDANDMPLGSATDYKSTLDAHAVWHFKAMVMASKTASAKFSSIAEDK